MSQLTLAARAKVSVGCLQGMEAGVRATRKDNLEKIARAIGLTLEELLHPADEIEPTLREDPRGRGLRDEDYEIAHLFHDASTDVRVAVRNQLRADQVDVAARDADDVRHMAPTEAQAVHDFVQAIKERTPPVTAPKKKAE